MNDSVERIVDYVLSISNLNTNVGKSIDEVKIQCIAFVFNELSEVSKSSKLQVIEDLENQLHNLKIKL